MEKKRLAGLDGIRLWAIILIVAEHTGFITENGAVGVALCFVLSGFLAVYIGGEHPEEKFFSLKKWIQYYVQRAFRILPMYYFCIAEVLYVILEKPIGDFGKHLSFKKLGQYYKGLFVREYSKRGGLSE